MLNIFMKIFIFTALVIVFGFSNAEEQKQLTTQAPQEKQPAEKKSGGSGKLDDITVTGEDKLKVKSEKPYLEVKLDINEVVMPTIETEKKFLEKNPKIEDAKNAIPKMLNSTLVAAPFLVAITKEPIANFSVKIVGVKNATWELVVTDSKGRVFKKFEGKGTPPSSIEWSGRNIENKIVKVGNAYSWLVNSMDDAGNPRTLVGSPFIIHVLLHQEDSGLYISITRKKLFDVEKDRIKLIEDNAMILREVSDILKDNYNLQIKVDVYGENPSIALDQAKTVAKYLGDLLIFPENKIKTNGFEESIENHRIDIVVKNR